MHEWALAEAVVNATLEISKKEELRQVTEVKLKVGELQQLDLKLFLFALSHLKKEKLKDTRFRIKKEMAKFRCRICGHEWNPRKTKLSEEFREAAHFIPQVAHAYIRCPKCSSSDFEICSGRGVWIENIRGRK
jgi:hydrogenase nickel incorporation protein HypA/HybF